jgi:hypothetical protein
MNICASKAARCAVAVFLVLALSGARAGQAATSAPGTPALVARAVAAYTANVRGIIGMQRHFSTVINGGPVHHTETSDSGLLLDNGAYAGIRYYKIADDGSGFTTAKIAQRNSQTNSDWAAGKVFFKEPYDSRYVSDYSFRQPATEAFCGTAAAVAFSSTVKDTQHGSGWMCIDQSTARITKLTYTPNAFPPHASSGSVTETSGTALSGMWYVTRIDETYNGHALIIHGSATFTGVVDHFRRFSSAASGKAALTNGTI